MIIDALETSLKKNRRSIKAIDKIILQKAIEMDRKVEGVSPQTDAKRKSLDHLVEQTKLDLEEHE